MRKGQVSIEYMIIVGFMFLLLVPLIYLYATTQKDSQDQLTEAQVLRVGNIIRDASERVYFAGEPAQETLQLYFPDNVKNLVFQNTSIIFTVAGGANQYELAVYGVAPMNGSVLFNKGVHIVTVRTQAGVVQVSE